MHVRLEQLERFMILVVIPVMLVLGIVTITRETKVDRELSITQETKRLCWEYAIRDHEKELSPARWEYLKTRGNPNDPEFFYQSCIGHITGEPARKEYMQ